LDRIYLFIERLFLHQIMLFRRAVMEKRLGGLCASVELDSFVLVHACSLTRCKHLWPVNQVEPCCFHWCNVMVKGNWGGGSRGCHWWLEMRGNY